MSFLKAAPRRLSLTSILLGLGFLSLTLAARPWSSSLPHVKVFADVVVVPNQKIPVLVRLPKDHELNREASSWLEWFSNSDDQRSLRGWKLNAIRMGNVTLPKLKIGSRHRLQGMIYHCVKKSVSACEIRGVEASVRVDEAGAEKVILNLED